MSFGRKVYYPAYEQLFDRIEKFLASISQQYQPLDGPELCFEYPRECRYVLYKGKKHSASQEAYIKLNTSGIAYEYYYLFHTEEQLSLLKAVINQITNEFKKEYGCEYE